MVPETFLLASKPIASRFCMQGVRRLDEDRKPPHQQSRPWHLQGGHDSRTWLMHSEAWLATTRLGRAVGAAVGGGLNANAQYGADWNGAGIKRRSG